MEEYAQFLYSSVQHGNVQGAQRPALQEVITWNVHMESVILLLTQQFIQIYIYSLVFALHREGWKPWQCLASEGEGHSCAIFSMFSGTLDH